LFHNIPFVPANENKKNTITSTTWRNKLHLFRLFQRIYGLAKEVKKARLLELLYFVK
jgi:hypothetical protein